MSYIREFSELSKEDTLLAGGKGASLGEMVQVGIPVPPGFVITTEAFEKVLGTGKLATEIKLILEQVTLSDQESLEQASQYLQPLLSNISLPTHLADEIRAAFKQLDCAHVAVRSSATVEDGTQASWAGELDSYLYVDETTLLEKVRNCWASLFTPRAIFYRLQHNLQNHSVSVAVVVQKMVQSEVSGIAFSVHPVTQDPNHLIIEAGYRLGEAIVSGAITPDSYVVNKKTLTIDASVAGDQDKQIIPLHGGGVTWSEVPTIQRAQPKLSPEKVTELAELVIKIERHYGFPCDIEWALENGTLYIVQSRPITTL